MSLIKRAKDAIGDAVEQTTVALIEELSGQPLSRSVQAYIAKTTETRQRKDGE